jgi:hypothetical protein
MSEWSDLRASLTRAVKRAERAEEIVRLGQRLADALAGYHGGPGMTVAEERDLLIEAANWGLLPTELIERRNG